MKIKKYFGGYLRYPKTTQERRVNGKRGKWNRAKRNARNLPSAWDDLWVHREKSWKKKRKTQYYYGGKGKRHELIIPYIRYFDKDGRWYPRLMDDWIFENYLRDHNIPYRIEEIKESRRYYNKYYKKYMNSITTIAHRFIWWSDKDIGLEYIGVL